VPVAAEYHRELARRLRTILGERLLGVYASGSLALEDFDPARSDLDVVAVAGGSVTAADKEEIVGRLRHEALPCPARGLEFVLYPEETVRAPSAEAAFLLNLNTGPRMAFRVDFEPGAVERHWFPIDRAIVRASGAAIAGPSPDELFAPIPRRLLVQAVREALEWHRAPGNGDDRDAVLNACRSIRWLREDVWSSKSAAGAWALARVADADLVAAALVAPDRGARLDRERVVRFVDAVLAEAVSRRPG